MHTVPHTAMPAMQPRFDCGHTGHEMLCGFGLNTPLRYADPSGWQNQPVITLPGGLSFYTLEGYHAYLRSLGHETPAFAGSYRYGPFQNGFGPGQFSGSGSLYAYDDYSTYDVVSNTFGNERWNGSFAGQVQSAYSNQQPNTYAQYEVNNDGSLNKTFETSMDNIQIVSSQNNINIYYTPLIAGNGPSGGSVLLSSHPVASGQGDGFSSSSVSGTGVLLQIADNVNTLYKHDTYRQTNGKIASIRKPNGQLRTSQQAQRAIRGSRLLKLGSFASNGFMAYNGVSSYAENGLTLRNGSDMVIGTLGTIAAGIVLFSNPVGWVATACIVVGAGSAIYGTATVGYDIYDEISGD